MFSTFTDWIEVEMRGEKEDERKEKDVGGWKWKIEKARKKR